MKHLLVASVVAVFASTVLADIQDPPGNDYGPTRKLGRGLSNLFLGGPAEVFVTVTTTNTREGNSAAAGYGVVNGVQRGVTRRVAGLLEVLTFPFPCWHESYTPLLPPDIPYIHAGYAEFPPELGNETKYDYVRDY
jgi:putative exosortase-associated protein (TIGR04073 family)